MTTTFPSSATAPLGEAPASSWDEPEGVAPRGTLVLLTGRGETAAAYGRFGRRISADAYKVRVIEVDLDDLAGAEDALRDLLADETLPSPRVLVGSDSGATFAAVLARRGDHVVDGVVLAGLALPRVSSTEAQSWDDELENRTACPAHRRIISEDAGFARGSLQQELPTSWTAQHLAPISLPTLVVHGQADPVTPLERALAPFRGASSTQTWVVKGGRHDVLNDVTHRSVAATIVLFLERLKLGADLPVIIRDDSRS